MKYRVGESVEFFNEIGQSRSGVIIDRIIKNEEKDGKPWCEIHYLVKPDGAKTFEEYKTLTRKDLRKPQYECIPDENENWERLELGGGFTLLMYSYVFKNRPRFKSKENKSADGSIYSTAIYDTEIRSQLHISYAICSKDDHYSIQEGLKICRSRLKKNPFIVLYSECVNEFDKNTVEAILKAKAEYIKNHKRRFINKKGEWFTESEEDILVLDELL